MAIIRSRREKNYTVLLNDGLRDQRLSFKARGLMAYMLSMPDDWKFYTRELVKHSDKDGRDSVRVGLKELEDCGYLKRQKKRSESGQFDSQDLLLVDTPTFSPGTDYPAPGKPATENPAPANPTLLSTNGTKDLPELSTEGTEHSPAVAELSVSFEDEFDVVWKEYPNKQGKKQAFNHYKAWRKKSVKHTNGYLLERLRLYKANLAANSWKHPMNGSTWFNGRFDDDYSIPASSAQGGTSYGGIDF